MPNPMLVKQAEQAVLDLEASPAPKILKILGSRAVTSALGATNGSPDKVQSLTENGLDQTVLITTLIAELPGMFTTALSSHVTSCPWQSGVSPEGASPALHKFRAWTSSFRPVAWPLAVIVIAAILKGQLSTLLDAFL